MTNIIDIISFTIITYFILINLSYLALFLVSYFGITKYKKISVLNDYIAEYQSELTPSISLLVPAYNEEETIIKNIRAFLSSFNYPEYEVIVINDGSKDRTLEKVILEFECEISDFPIKRSIHTQPIINIYKSKKYPKLIVVNKINGGKADALNAGINVSSFPFFGSIDADTILEKDSYLKVVMPIIYDKNVVASGGVVGVINGCDVVENRIEKINYPKNILAKFQVVEYLRAFLFGRYAWSRINSLPLISGAFGLFNKAAVIRIGGYSSSKTKSATVGEDMELVMRLHRFYLEKKEDYKIVFVPDPLSWTQVPEDFKTLKNQRSRWQRGLMETIFNNFDIMFNKKYKLIGLLAFPYYFIFELLAPVVELTGYILFPYFYFNKMISLDVFVAFFIVSILVGVLISLLAVLLEIMTFRRYKNLHNIFDLLFYAVLENFGYRQLTLVYRILGFFQYFMKSKSWGEMKRKSL